MALTATHRDGAGRWGWQLALLARARGGLSSAQLDDVRRSLESDPHLDVPEFLVERGFVAAPTLRVLTAELGQPPRWERERPPESSPPAGITGPAGSGETSFGVTASGDSPSDTAVEIPLPPFLSPAPANEGCEGESSELSPELAAELLLRPVEEHGEGDVDGDAAAAPGGPAAASVSAVAAGSQSRLALRMKIDVLLAAAEEAEASDLHIHAGEPVMMRVHGKLLQSEAPALSPAESEAALMALFSDAEYEDFLQTQDVDFAYVTTFGLRTRANVFRQQNGVDGVFRLVPRTVPTLESLSLPEELATFTHHHAGLVLVTGPAGCGKSTTLAALVDRINDERDDHILTIEDPIEIVHESKRCLVNQRQVKRHTDSFARALRAALREDPDVIVIGELRDLETISLALTAAETGHLVIGSLHTNSAARTIGRILDVFPPEQQPQVRSMISESLRGVISQRLIPTVDGKRAVALEVLAVTPAISNLIRDDKLHQVRSAMQTGRSLGMRLLSDSVRELLIEGRVSLEDARPYLDQPLSQAQVDAAQAQRTASTSPVLTPTRNAEATPREATSPLGAFDTRTPTPSPTRTPTGTPNSSATPTSKSSSAPPARRPARSPLQTSPQVPIVPTVPSIPPVAVDKGARRETTGNPRREASTPAGDAGSGDSRSSKRFGFFRR